MRSHDPDKMTTTPLESFPPEDQWDDWAEYDPSAWPKKVEKRYQLVPTICFNCEAACGLMAFIDREWMPPAATWAIARRLTSSMSVTRLRVALLGIVLLGRG